MLYVAVVGACLQLLIVLLLFWHGHGWFSASVVVVLARWAWPVGLCLLLFLGFLYGLLLVLSAELVLQSHSWADGSYFGLCFFLCLSWLCSAACGWVAGFGLVCWLLLAVLCLLPVLLWLSCGWCD